MDKKNESVKINISMKKSILDMVDEYAENMGINRSAFISICCASYIQQQKALFVHKSANRLLRSDN